jgi:hypothetical protein
MKAQANAKCSELEMLRVQLKQINEENDNYKVRIQQSRQADIEEGNNGNIECSHAYRLIIA